MRKLNSKGITLITLVITIIVLIILASVAAYSGINVIHSSQLTTFTTEMKLAQTKVNELYNKMQTGEKLVIGGTTYKGEDDDNANNTKGFKKLGDLIGSDSQATTAIAKAKEFNSSYDYNNIDDYKKYTVDTLKNIGVEGIKQELLINIKKRKVISYNGLEQNGKVYYILEQLPDSMYNVDYSNNNTGNPGIAANYEELGNWRYRINVSVGYNNGNIEKWNVKYKLSTEEKWSTSYDLSFIVEHAGVYDIKVENNGIESDESQVRVTNKADTEYRDAYGNLVIVPGGFFVSNVSSESSVDTGVVIIGPDDSEFVWVPVDKKTLCADGTADKEIAKLQADSDKYYEGISYEFSGTTSSKITSVGLGTSSYREPSLVTNGVDYTWNVTTPVGTEFDASLSYYKDILGYNSAKDFGIALNDEYTAIINSIKTNGGFYVGRYEASISGDTIKTVKDVTPMSAKADSGNMWYGIYQKEQNYAIKLAERYSSIINTNLKSAMITGSCYDAMLNWALNGEDKDKVTVNTNGNHSGLPVTTGNATYSNDKINNIFDLEGNLREWTTEAVDIYRRVSRRRRLR